jgi:hypothetical protein
VGYVLIDYPRRQWLVHEDITGAYLAHHTQISNAQQIAPLHASRISSPRVRDGILLCAIALLGEVGCLWPVGHLRVLGGFE